MAEVFPDTSPKPQSALGYDGADFRTLKVDVDGHSQVDVLTSALPSGAATAANQTTEITALQLIDDLRNALKSVATDQLQVKGKDQLFSYKAQLLVQVTAAATAATTVLTTDAVPAGEIWDVTAVAIRNLTRAIPAGGIGIKLDGNVYYWLTSGSTAGSAIHVPFSGHMYLEAGNRVAVYITGCTVDDSLEMNVNGYKMTKEA